MPDRRFPIMVPRHGGNPTTDCPTSVPWALVANRQERALANHSQTLERLAERGGLSPQEFMALISDRHWKETIRHTDYLASEFVKRCVADPAWALGEETPNA